MTKKMANYVFKCSMGTCGRETTMRVEPSENPWCGGVDGSYAHHKPMLFLAESSVGEPEFFGTLTKPQRESRIWVDSPDENMGD